MTLAQLRILVAAMLGLLMGLLLVLRFAEQPHMIERDLTNGATNAPVVEPVPTVGLESAQAILSRSPFAQDRGPFTRAVEAAPPEVRHSIRLVSIRRAAGGWAAVLLIDGQEISVTAGDHSPAGPVTEITNSGVRIGERWLDLFSDNPEP